VPGILAALLAASCASAPQPSLVAPALADQPHPGGIDALGSSDRPILESLPTFSRLMREGSYSFSVTSTFPSLTSVAHASIQTGVPPAVHEIGQNLAWNPDRPWPPGPRYGYRRQLAVDTIFDAARRKGLSTAAVLFPLTGGAPITWNFPEVVSPKGNSSSILSSVLAGNPFYLLGLELRFGKMHRGTTQPFFDDFISRMRGLDHSRPSARALLATHWLDWTWQKHRHWERPRRPSSDAGAHDARLARLLGLG
jgi:hypothetical protein